MPDLQKTTMKNVVCMHAKKLRRRFLTRARTTNSYNKELSVTTIASSGVGYGPRHVCRTTHDLILETTFLVFGDDLDIRVAAAYIIYRKRAAVCWNH